MARISQKIRIEAEPGKVFDALTTRQGYQGWWTTSCEVSDKEVDLRFEDGNIGSRFRFDEQRPDLVSLTCVANKSIPEWQDTRLVFNLVENGGKTELDFVHDDWKAADTEKYKICVGGWDYFLRSLKSYVETGAGTPHDK
jgi:uncharacterized protein YndB with AHSA1/START domain